MTKSECRNLHWRVSVIRHSRSCRLSGRLIALFVVAAVIAAPLHAENWPRWRGPDGNAVSGEKHLPVRWTTTHNVQWKSAIKGEGASSPIVYGEHLFVTAAEEDGTRRSVHALDARTGRVLWSRSIKDDYPEITSALTGHAAPTPVTDGRRVVAFFGNAGVVCYDFDGRRLWHRSFGDFESELGIASSPVIDGGRVILVCDHDGDRFTSFDSFLIALDVKSGETLWKTARRGLYRSWSTPVLVPVNSGRRRSPAFQKSRASAPAAPRGMRELIVNAQDELRGYDPRTGRLLWRVRGMTGWVTPSPVFSRGQRSAVSGQVKGQESRVEGPGPDSPDGDARLALDPRPSTLDPRTTDNGQRTTDEVLIYAASGKDGPTLAVRPGGRGDVTDTHVLWREKRGAPYVCSPLFYRGLLYVHNELGVVTCRRAATGKIVYRRRLADKFIASGVAGDGKVYLTNEKGTTFVIAAGETFRLLAENPLEEETLASPAVSGGRIFIRTRSRLYCIGKPEPRSSR